MARQKKDGRRPSGRSGDAEKDCPGVGYGCPPQETRFKPGQSGNPKGRSRQVPTVHAVLDKVLGGHVELREGERTRRVSKLVALFETAVNRALKGDYGSLRAILQVSLAKPIEDQSEVAANQVAGADDEAILADYRARLGAEGSTSAAKVDNAIEEPAKSSEASKPKRDKR